MDENGRRVKRPVDEQNGPDELDDTRYGTKEIHSAYLPMMDEFHDYCMRYKIRYSLSGGTLLGAVRHGGFIPWDDDVDVMFTRADYDAFLEAFSRQPMDGYEIVGSTWVKRLTKCDNLQKDDEEQCIDLFVFDEVPDRAVLARLKVFVLLTLQGMMKEKPEYERFSLKNKVLLFGTWLLGRFFTQKAKQRAYDRISQMGHGGKITVYNTMVAQMSKLEFGRSMMSAYSMRDFAGRQYMAIDDYDTYLTKLYGDYMQLPPEAQRVNPHRK